MHHRYEWLKSARLCTSHWTIPFSFFFNIYSKILLSKKKTERERERERERARERARTALKIFQDFFFFFLFFPNRHEPTAIVVQVSFHERSVGFQRQTATKRNRFAEHFPVLFSHTNVTHKLIGQHDTKSPQTGQRHEKRSPSAK